MSYTLHDPYHYTPKCYPFTNSSKPYSRHHDSQRLTKRNQQIQTSLYSLKCQYSSEMNQEKINSEINFLRIKQQLQQLNKTKLNPKTEVTSNRMGDVKAEIIANRKVKEEGLRKMSHQFPHFVRHRQLLTGRNVPE